MKTKITFLITFLFITFMISTVKATIHTVQVANFSFSPSVLNIHSGDTVKWVWVSGSHTTTGLTCPTGATLWDSPINSTNTQFELKFIIVGTYTYNCSMHPSTMQGTINVSAATGINEIINDSHTVNIYPNPFTSYVSISFSKSETGLTKISIYDITGKLVKLLVNSEYEKGDHVISWDGRNENGESVKQGLYFYMIEDNGQSKIGGKVVYGS